MSLIDFYKHFNDIKPIDYIKYNLDVDHINKRFIFYKNNAALIAHRDGDLPASVSKYCIEYYNNGFLHRLNGPAVIMAAKKEYFFLYGTEYDKNEWEIRKQVFLKLEKLKLQ